MGALNDPDNDIFIRREPIKIGHNEIPGDKLYWKRYQNWYISMKEMARKYTYFLLSLFRQDKAEPF